MTKAYVLICCDAGKEDSVISSLNNVESIKNAHGTFGTYDIITKLDGDELTIQSDITQKIRKIPKIRSTLTLMANGDTLNKTTDEEKDVLRQHMAQAYVIVHCRKSDESQVLTNLGKIPEVIEGNTLTGSFEVICNVTAPTYNEISDIVTKKIRKLDNIKGTITLNVVSGQGFSR